MTPERRAALVDSLMDAIDGYVRCEIDAAMDPERWPGSCKPDTCRDVLRSAILDLVEELE